MPKRTYEVMATPTAIRRFMVQASSPREALEIAEQRMERSARAVRKLGWTLDFGSGTEDEHWSVQLDGIDVMPDEWDDEEDEDAPLAEVLEAARALLAARRFERMAGAR